jgi:hypothetical protein
VAGDVDVPASVEAPWLGRRASGLGGATRATRRRASGGAASGDVARAARRRVARLGRRAARWKNRAACRRPSSPSVSP